MSIAYSTDPDYFERLDGRDYPKVSPKTAHSLVEYSACTILRRAFGERAKVVLELRCRIGAVDGTDSHLVPDIAVLSAEQWAALQTLADRQEPPFAPDIAVEIRSPGESAELRRHKVERYFATGSRLILDIDIATRSVHAISASGTKTFASGERMHSDAIPTLTFDIAELFEDLDDDM